MNLICMCFIEINTVLSLLHQEFIELLKGARGHVTHIPTNVNPNAAAGYVLFLGEYHNM